MRRRRRLLVSMALLGCVAIFVLAHLLANRATVLGHWSAGERGELLLLSSERPALAGLQGRTLVGIAKAGGTSSADLVPLDASLLHRAPRWQPQDQARARSLAQNAALDTALAQGSVQLHFSGGETVDVATELRGYAGLGWWFWPLVGAALALYLFGWALLLARPQARNVLFLVITLCQAGNLLLIAVQTLPGLGLGLPPQLPLLGLDLGLRFALDVITAAAITHAFALHPKHLAQARAVAAGVWATALVATLVVGSGVLHQAWWWAQAVCVGMGGASLLVMAHSYRLEPNPYALALRRLALAALGTLLLVTVAVAAACDRPTLAHGVAVGASVAWYLFLASLLMLAPFLAGSRQLLREFALLAGISTVAASLDLLFVALFSLGPFTSLALAVFVSVALYTSARQVLLNQMLGSRALTTERTFEQLYRAARAVQAQPARYSAVIAQLLQELFEPLQCSPVAAAGRVPSQAQVSSAGSALVVPVWAPGGGNLDPETGAAAGLVLRFAQRGQRLFTSEDALLADRVVEQLRRAVAYDHAVERGRTEERLRLAQDLHDDIGARLLTLMYQAPNPEMEDYIRHTLQDLKTLTRGLAASQHRLSHAAAEWKADLTQRLTAARAELVWTFTSDHDAQLSVVQWSALTRILRELVTNALYHGNATRVEVVFTLQAQTLHLAVLDDGQGHNPQSWAHGLGLGGVRKRVKLLGGEVAWADNPPRGIACRVRLPEFTTPDLPGLAGLSSHA
jgi:signal transduction histidine kinase